MAALGYFASGAAGGVVSLTNPLAGGAITSAGNAVVDIATKNVPSFNNAGDALLYIGKEAAFGAATSFAGAQAGKIIGPALSKLGNSVGGWFKHGFQTYAQESIETIFINGKPITTTIDIGIKATKQYVSKALGGSFGNVFRSEFNSVGAYRNAITPFKNGSLTEAGRAVTKHPEYFGFESNEVLRQVYRSDAQINNLASGRLKEVLRRGTISTGAGGRYPNGWTTFTLPNGNAASWGSNGSFIGFRGIR